MEIAKQSLKNDFTSLRTLTTVARMGPDRLIQKTFHLKCKRVVWYKIVKLNTVQFKLHSIKQIMLNYTVIRRMHSHQATAKIVTSTETDDSNGS